MNAYFKTLADLLPPYQEGRKRNKVDILIHASKYIKDLHSRSDELFSAHASEAHKEELARLKKLVTQLFSRTQLLSTLLREAGISVPAEPALEKISPLKWSNKINLEDAEKYFDKIEEIKSSENRREKSTELKVPSKRKCVNSSQSSTKKLVENNDISKDANSLIENQENQVNCANSKDDISNATGNISEAGSKESECCQTNTSSEVPENGPLNGKTNNGLQKVESQKKVKRKVKKKDGKKPVTPCINNSVTNLTPNTLILSGGKLMPLVTPVASNIIVNAQQQPANPIILSNTQQNQMFVMQPLTNRVQNSVVSICNQALINTVQKVTLNTVPSIRTNVVVDSQNWASNVKNIINATKIGGHKGILPKEVKTICENYNYVPLHKENSSFSNVLTNDVYSGNSTVAGNIEKSRMKSGMDAQKQGSFVDPSKTRNIQSSVPQSTGKQSRMQSQTTSSGANDYNKFNNAENKNKSKYGIESEYIQNEYTGLEQQSQQQQHGPKNHQSINQKQEKAVYPMSTYDSQVSFELPEVTTQMKYTVDYTGANFKYPDKSQQQNQNKYQPLIQGQVASLQHDSVSYSNNNGKHGQQQPNTTKSKTNQQQQAIRAPVNWMMTPEIKHNANIADIILPPIGKELDFCQNNLFAQTPSYNQGTTNQFYNNYDVAAHSFPNLPVLQTEPKRTTDVFYSEEQPFPWSPTKTSVVHAEQTQSVKGIDQHIVSSSLPTLVGDLDLGTNLPEKQNFLFGQVSSRVVPSDQNKDLAKDKEGNVTGRDFHSVLNSQTVQHSGVGPSFLSQQQQQARKNQRKNNTSPRGNSKRQMDIRKQTSSNEQLHPRHDEQKPAGHSFTEQGYQQHQQQQHLPTADTVMPINYFSNTDDGSGYGQMVNQNFNSYTYSSNTNIYPTSNFITSISNTPTSYMMPLHDNADYMEANAFLLSNVATSSTATSSSTSTVTTSTSNVNTNTKNHQHYAKHQNCDKRTYSTNATKKAKRKGPDGGTMQNLEFPLSGINSPLEDYHHSATFLPPPPPPHASPLYQNHPQANVYTKAVNSLPPPPPPPSVAGSQGVPTVATAGFSMNPNMPRGGIVSSNPMAMSHHPSGTSLTNFNLSTIFPEMNDKITGYKPSNGIPTGLTQPPNQTTAYAQRTNYSTNPLCHLPQVSEGSQFGNGVPPPPPPPPPGVIHYKNV
ncbi:hypothetical protein WN55_06696 [Dufourea novaeangliae]|uniref:BHLH domain-containing protein n=1 Tax=Dufourea novaeangliae TaxID=178035 RepID=A0A154PR50_DUFNO|nr:hypothetical protein WN55_06696 [Dufourea novaeangliae]